MHRPLARTFPTAFLIGAILLVNKVISTHHKHTKKGPGTQSNTEAEIFYNRASTLNPWLGSPWHAAITSTPKRTDDPPTLQPSSSSPALQLSISPTLELSNSRALQLCSPTLQLSNCPTLQPSNPPTLQLSNFPAPTNARGQRVTGNLYLSRFQGNQKEVYASN